MDCSPFPLRTHQSIRQTKGLIRWNFYMCLDPLLIVLEYLPYGDLLGYLRKSRGHSDSYKTGEKKLASKLTAKDLLSFAWMIADGMYYLAEMKVS